MSHKLLDPWAEAIDEYPLTGPPDQRLRAALRYAVLAPSSHNSQPWLVRLRDEVLELFADRSRALPVVDPEDRELTISCGVLLRFLRIALNHWGQGAAVELLPDPKDPDLLARVRLAGVHAPSDRDHAMFHAIRTRRTNRYPFDPRPVPELVLGRARTVAEREQGWLQTLTGEEDRIALANFIADGDRVQLADRRFRRELAAWVHSNRSGSRDGMPGYAHGVGTLASTVGPLVIRTFDIGDGKAARDRELALGSPVLAVLWTEEDSTPAWLAAGQALGGTLLSLEADGVAVSYLNQPIEVPELREQVQVTLGRAGFPQLILRLGFGRPCRPTPRRPVADVLLEPAHPS